MKIKLKQCDYPNCESKEAKRIDIKTSWFRGDDIVLNACKEHKAKNYHTELLQTDKAKKQFT